MNCNLCIDPLNLILTLLRCAIIVILGSSYKARLTSSWDFILLLSERPLWYGWIAVGHQLWLFKPVDQVHCTRLTYTTKRLIYPTCIHLLGSVISSFLEGHYFFFFPLNSSKGIAPVRCEISTCNVRIFTARMSRGW